MADAGPGAARVNQPALRIVIAKEKGAEEGPGPLGIGPANDHELLAVQAFDLESQAAIAGGVRRIGALRNDPFQL
jgi:hypothetical protein